MSTLIGFEAYVGGLSPARRQAQGRVRVEPARSPASGRAFRRAARAAAVSVRSSTLASPHSTSASRHRNVSNSVRK